jgi:hypothetical protein
MKIKKIACIANMNNNMFCLVRYLRDRGYDAHLFLVEEFAHFLPECDSYDNEYLNYTHQLDWYSIGHWKISANKIKKDLTGYDFIICCDRVPSYLQKAKIKIDMFIPHGGDVFHMTFYKFEQLIPKKWEIGAFYQAFLQKKAIRNASYMMCELTNDEFENHITKLRVKGKRLFSILPIVYSPQYNVPAFTNSTAQIQKIREANNFIVFHQSRHIWKSDPTSLHYKANDMLIEAFADFVKSNKNISSLLIMFEYGEDYLESKKLVKNLEIEDNVLWLPLMERKDLMKWLNISDIGVGGLGASWLAYGSLEEIMALKKPFIGRRDDDLYKEHYKNLYPMVSVKSKLEIFNVFKEYFINTRYFRDMGLNSYLWFKEFIVENTIDQIIYAIENKEKEKENGSIENKWKNVPV